MTRLQLPRLGPLEAAWLWLSFQRYALLLGLLAAAPLAVAAGPAGGAWWAWAIAGPLSLPIAARAVAVGRRGPAKLHALRVALYRVQRATFTPESVRRHCGDPCFRLVAHEALRRAGVPAAERRRIVAAHARALRAEASALVIIDHRRGEVVEHVGDETRVRALIPAP